MLVFRRLVPLLAALLVALPGAASCVYYTDVPELVSAADSGAPGDAATSSSGVSSSGFAVAPAFAPSFDNDGGAGVRVYPSSCVEPTGARMATDGMYTYASGCMEQARFAAQIPICAGGTIHHSLAKISGSVVVSGGGTMAVRTGTMLYAIDLDMPCRQTTGKGQCIGIQNLLVSGLGTSKTPAVVQCYDVSETICQCQAEVSIDLAFGPSLVGAGTFYNEKVPFWVDQLGAMTLTRITEQFKLYPEATGYWRLSP